MAIALRYAARTDIGLGRYTNNQDSGYAGPNLLVVADGMGGHAGGDVASSIAVGELAALDGQSHGPDAVRRLEDTIAQARRLLLERARQDPRLAGMGTTVTALLRSGRRLVLAHIGDSRAYLLRDGALSQVTSDHTFVQRLVDEGRITPEEAEQHPQRSVILRVLGDVESDGQLDVSVRDAEVGDRWLLCSDGLSGVVSSPTLREILTTVPEPALCAERLVDLALRAGAPDNVTCVVADVVEADGAPPASPQVVGAAGLAADGGASRQPNPAVAAAELAAEEPRDDQAAAPPAPAGRQRRRLLAVLAVIAVLVAGGYAAYAWQQRQFYVGNAGGDVAIYRGLTQDVGPVRLSRVYEPQDLPVEALPQVWSDRVDDGILAADLPDARRIVRQLLRGSDLCEPRPQPSRAAAGPTPSGPAPSGPAPSSPSPSSPAPSSPAPTVTALPPVQPDADLPEGCQETGR